MHMGPEDFIWLHHLETDIFLNIIIIIISPHCDLDFENSNHKKKKSHDTPPQNDVPPHTVWFQKIEQFRRYLLAKAMTEGHKDMVISATPPPYTPALWSTFDHAWIYAWSFMAS